ncbi:MAG: hypothetical protein PVSMB7_09710 [Chloroflexota bacterium]
MATIAVVDPDPGIQSLVADVLAMAGHCTTIIGRTDDAQSRVQAERPDLILLDVWLDDPADGWNTLRSLTEDEATSRVPVIIMSSTPQELANHEQWLSERRVSILAKPFTIDQLCTSVEAALHDSECHRPEAPNSAQAVVREILRWGSGLTTRGNLATLR